MAGVAVAQPQFLTPSQPRDLMVAKKGVEIRPQELKRGTSAGRIARMKPGEERDGKVVRLEDKGQVTTWQGREGRVSTISSPSSEGGSREDGRKRLRQLGAFTARDEDELSFKPGSIITVLRVSETSPRGWIVGALDGKRATRRLPLWPATAIRAD